MSVTSRRSAEKLVSLPPLLTSLYLTLSSTSYSFLTGLSVSAFTSFPFISPR